MNCCPEYFTKIKTTLYEYLITYTNIDVNKKSKDKVEPEIINKQPEKNEISKDKEWDII
jgi:hypothetical protein